LSITQGCFCLLIFFKHCSYFDAFWGKINISLSQVIFSSFYIGFIVNFNVTCGHYCNWHVLNIIWNKKTCQGVHSKRQHLDDPYVVRAMHVGSSSHETPPFKLVFRRSRHLLYDGVAHGLEVPLVWRRYLFFFFRVPFSPLLKFNVIPFKNSDQFLQFLFHSHLVDVILTIIFFYHVQVIKLKIFFNPSPFIF
jgi:hypothetical protein